MSPAKAIDALVQALGDDLVATGPGIPDRRHGDWSGVPYSVPLALLRPRNTEQLARMLHICNELGQPVVPQGGLTGLAGGACCGSGEVAVSLERMNAIEEIDAVSGTLTAQAGCTLQAVQEAAEAAGFLFALDLGARGTCTIGGNLSTNAGGNRVIRYGTMRDQLVGVEAVLADGSVVGGLHKMVKNNTGYDLRHLLAGAEGTLGIVTRVVLKLHPQPKSVSTAWCGLPDYDAVTILLQRAKAELPGGVSAFEVMWPSYLDFMLGKVKGLRAPLSRRHAMNVLMESAGADAVRQASEFDEFLARMLEEGVLEDATVARSTSDARTLWAVRDATAEFPILLPGMAAFDVSFAIGDIGRAALECEALLRQRWPHCTALVYGHLGDGNLHVIAHVADGAAAETRAIEEVVYDLVRRYRGAVSAEHGIGILKRNVLGHTRSPAELAAMRAIKQALDPKGILNPGKVL
jgi:FAD/FMN-containing dehydrogenase